MRVAERMAKKSDFRENHSLDIGFIPWNKDEIGSDRHSLEDYEDVGEVLENE
jgi:hypothetical protein